jgi:wyosine [tRNA(Phe)-imidazoG37] synthetase (radical SAM superfamily)
MDSLIEDEFKAMNRPHPKLRLDSMAQDLTTFRKSYSGKIYLEVLLVSGVNNTPGNLQRLERYVRELQPDRVDVATMTRPGTSNKAAPVEPEELARWRDALHAKQIIRKSSDLRTKDIFQTENLERIREMVLSSISRRPQTADDLASALAVSHSDVERVLTGLVQQGKARITWEKEQVFYGTC